MRYPPIIWPLSVRREFRRFFLVIACLCSLQAYSQTCTASFQVTNNANGTVTFSSTTTSGGTISSSSWYFPGGTPSVSSSNSTVNVTYPSNGTYTAYLMSIVAPSGNTCTTWGVFTVTGVCTLSASYTYTLGPNGQASFSSTSSGATSYTWVPGNVNAPTFSTTFPSNGSYPVTLFVSNGTCHDSVSLNIPINSICTLSANASYSLGPGGQVQFINNTTGTASPATYTWELGDGNTSTAWSPAHTYTANGTYVATLTAVNNSMVGCSSSYTMLVNVNNIICFANFTYSVLPNGVVTFSSTSQPATLTSFYSWNFNGSTYTAIGSPTAIMSYTANGNYPVSLNFSSGTCTDVATYTVFVNSIIPCLIYADFTYSVGPNGVVSFTNTSGGTTTATSYNWSFGDNSTSTLFSPLHTYSANGSYSVTLTAKNDSTGNCASDTTLFIFVNTYSCALQASFAHTVGINGFVTYSSTSTGTQVGQKYSWNFGDGFSGAGKVVNHTYQNGGTHYVYLFISDTINSFCSDTLAQAVNITGISCTANAGFTLTPTSTPQYWTATPIYPWNIVSARWTWGDGSHNDSLYVSHTYSASGQYNICLTVTASCGSTATACASYSVYRSSGTLVHVNVEPPSIVGFSELAQQPAPGLILFPVPTNEKLMVQFEGFTLGISNLIVTDFLGRILYQKPFEPANATSAVLIDVADLPEGIYLLHIINGSVRSSGKFIVDR